MALLLTWSIIGVACAVGCAVAQLVGRRVDDAEAERSRRQWRLMCEALGAEDFAGDHALAEFSEAYADQNERDYNTLVQAERDGRITAQRGL